MLRKLSSVITGVMSAMAAQTTTFASAAIDVKDYDGNFIVQQYSESTNGANVTFNGVIQHSDDGSTGWVTVATFTEVDNTVGGALESVVIEVDALKRYIRHIGVIAGISPSFVCGASYSGYKKQ